MVFLGIDCHCKFIWFYPHLVWSPLENLVYPGVSFITRKHGTCSLLAVWLTVISQNFYTLCIDYLSQQCVHVGLINQYLTGLHMYIYRHIVPDMFSNIALLCRFPYRLFIPTAVGQPPFLKFWSLLSSQCSNLCPKSPKESKYWIHLKMQPVKFEARSDSSWTVFPLLLDTVSCQQMPLWWLFPSLGMLCASM